MGTQSAPVHSGIWPGLFTERERTQGRGPALSGPIMFQVCRTSHMACLGMGPGSLIRLSTATPQSYLRDLPHELLPGEPWNPPNTCDCLSWGLRSALVKSQM